MSTRGREAGTNYRGSASPEGGPEPDYVANVFVFPNRIRYN
jgi:hypothetical protein